MAPKTNPNKAKGQSKNVTPAEAEIRANKYASDENNDDDKPVCNHLKKKSTRFK